MSDPKLRYGLIAVGVIAIAFLVWSIFGRRDATIPTEATTPGASANTRTPDDPAPGAGHIGH